MLDRHLAKSPAHLPPRSLNLVRTLFLKKPSGENLFPPCGGIEGGEGGVWVRGNPPQVNKQIDRKLKVKFRSKPDPQTWVSSALKTSLCSGKPKARDFLNFGRRLRLPSFKKSPN
jgi:hypothetical protein